MTYWMRKHDLINHILTQEFEYLSKKQPVLCFYDGEQILWQLTLADH